MFNGRPPGGLCGERFDEDWMRLEPVEAGLHLRKYVSCDIDRPVDIGLCHGGAEKKTLFQDRMHFWYDDEKSKRYEIMEQRQFQEWVSGVGWLSPSQRRQLPASLQGRAEQASSLSAVEVHRGENRRYPHCAAPGALSRGKARGLRRYQCKVCRKTFNAATGTALQGLHKKDRFPAFGLAVRKSAERCGIALATAFHCRHRFLETRDGNPARLTGMVEADETGFPGGPRRTAQSRTQGGAAQRASRGCQPKSPRCWSPQVAAARRPARSFVP